MKVFYSDTFVLPLPPGHRFPMQKYALVRQSVAAIASQFGITLHLPHAADDTALLRAHTSDYVKRMQHGDMTAAEIRRIGFPWSAAMVERSRRSSGATIEACRAALEDGVAANLAGGTHHACTDHGEGFCIFNDSAVAARAMQAEGRVRQVLIVDCDVHQGNGSAEILRGDSSVFTFSIHGEKNFPFRKEAGDLDIGLDDGTDDDGYLSALEWGLTDSIARARPDLAIYLAGADPLASDTLGRLSLTPAGMLERDHLVFRSLQAAGVPFAITMAGGYAHPIEDTVGVHVQTIQAAARLLQPDSDV